MNVSEHLRIKLLGERRAVAPTQDSRRGYVVLVLVLAVVIVLAVHS